MSGSWNLSGVTGNSRWKFLSSEKPRRISRRSSGERDVRVRRCGMRRPGRGRGMRSRRYAAVRMARNLEVGVRRMEDEAAERGREKTRAPENQGRGTDRVEQGAATPTAPARCP